MRPTRAGQILLALSFIGLGLLSLGSGDFALNWQPVPAWVPARAALAYLSGVMLLGGGVGLVLDRTARRSALLLAINVLLWLVLLRLPRVAASPTSAAMWLGFGETLMLVTGFWVLAAPARHTRAAQILFGLALIPVGISHIVYLQQTAALVPVWMPNRSALAYMTGIAHMAAGLAIVIGPFARMAASLEGAMLATFGLLVWAPTVLATHTRLSATAFLITAASAGAAWTIAGSISPRLVEERSREVASAGVG